MIENRNEKDRERYEDFISELIARTYHFVNKELPGDKKDLSLISRRISIMSEIVSNYVCNLVHTFINKEEKAAFPSVLLDFVSDITLCANTMNFSQAEYDENNNEDMH